MEKTDLYLPDVMPLALTRTYNSLDNDPERGWDESPIASFGWTLVVVTVIPKGGVRCGLEG
jgi:hypothetical protein